MAAISRGGGQFHRRDQRGVIGAHKSSNYDPVVAVAREQVGLGKSTATPAWRGAQSREGARVTCGSMGRSGVMIWHSGYACDISERGSGLCRSARSFENQCRWPF